VALIFHDLSPILLNLRRVHIHAVVSQSDWNSILLLPALKELRLWPTHHSKRETAGLNFQGLSKLQEFEITSLLKGEVFALGAAVRESSLMKLCIVKGAKLFPAERSILKRFVYGLVKRNRNGFLGSLVGDGLWGSRQHWLSYT
jgi:hypothetical protein